MSGYLTNLVARTIEPVVSVQPRLTPLFGPVTDDVREPMPAQVAEINPSSELPQSLIAAPLVQRPSHIEQNSSPVNPRRSAKQERHLDVPPSERLPHNERHYPQPNAQVPENRMEDPAKRAEPIEFREQSTRSAVVQREQPELPVQKINDNRPGLENRETTIVRERRKDQEPEKISKIVAQPLDGNEESKRVYSREHTSDPPENRVRQSSLSTELEALRRDVQQFQERILPSPGRTREAHQGDSRTWEPAPVSPKTSLEVPEDRRDHVLETRRLTPRQTERSREEQSAQQPEQIIQVTIGRIEVRTGQPSQLPKKAAAQAATLGLNEYLRQRSGRSHG
jgi:hypothetical protein